jgi:hypothetical protein
MGHRRIPSGVIFLRSLRERFGKSVDILCRKPHTEMDAMWEAIQSLLTGHRKAFEITGDSLTFLGGMLMAAEALWKTTERIAIATTNTFLKYFPDAEDRTGRPIESKQVEETWQKRWSFTAKLGAVVLTAGFLILLLCRIFAE